jgi:hypothetical protein
MDVSSLTQLTIIVEIGCFVFFNDKDCLHLHFYYFCIRKFNH